MADTIKQKIIFAMGTTGMSSATKSFASMGAKVAVAAAAIGVAVKGMSKLYDAAVTLDRQMNALSTDMTLYNSQTKGLIDTNDGLSAAIQLQQANIKATKEEMAAMGKAAIQMNQKLGGDAAGATTIFNGLVKSIVNARETGLVKFGVELSQTANKTEASNEALEKLVEKFGGIEVKAETAKEKIYSFNNSLGTVAAFEFNQLLDDMTVMFGSMLSGLGDMSEAMQLWEADLIATNGQLAENYSALTDLDVVQLAYNETVLESLERGEDLYILEGRLIIQNEGVSRSTLEKAKAYVEQKKRIQEVIFIERELEKIQARKRAESVQGGNVEKIGGLVDMMRESGTSAGVLAAYNKASKLASKHPDANYSQLELMEVLEREQARTRKEERFIASSMGSGGGRGGGKSPAETAPVAPPVAPPSTVDDMSGATPVVRMAQWKGSGGLTPGQESGAGAGAAQTEAGRLAREQQFQAEMAQLKMGQQQSTFQSLLGMEAQYLEESRKMNELSNEQKAANIETMGGAVAGTFANMSTAIDKDSKAGFKASKAMAYSANIVQTLLSSTSAFRSVMQSGMIFPANVIAATALSGSVIAAGAATGRKIREQKYGGGGGISAPPKVNFPTGGMGAGSGDSGNSYVFNVNVDGDRVYNSVLKQNELAKQSNDPHLSTGAA